MRVLFYFFWKLKPYFANNCLITHYDHCESVKYLVLFCKITYLLYVLYIIFLCGVPIKHLWDIKLNVFLDTFCLFFCLSWLYNNALLILSSCYTFKQQNVQLKIRNLLQLELKHNDNPKTLRLDHLRLNHMKLKQQQN